MGVLCCLKELCLQKDLSSGKARSQGRRRAPLVLSQCLQPWKKLLRQKVYLQNLGLKRPNLKAYKKLGKLLKPARTESTSGFGWNHAAWKQNSVSAIATLPFGSGHTKCQRKQPTLYNCTVTVGKMSAKVVLKVGLDMFLSSNSILLGDSKALPISCFQCLFASLQRLRCP